MNGRINGENLVLITFISVSLPFLILNQLNFFSKVMDQNRDNTMISEISFSFQQLLCGEDWHLWDTFPTVDANTSSPDLTVEMNHDGLTVESDPLVMPLTRVIIYYLLDIFKRN